MVCATAGHAGLVVGTQGGSWPRQPPEVHKEGVGILSGTQGEMPNIEGVQQPLHTAGLPLPRQGLIPAPSGHAVQ